MSARVRRLALAALLLAGCRFDLTRNTPGDRGTPRDASRDAPRDLASEAASRDQSPPDRPDLPRDGTPGDGTPKSEAMTVDMFAGDKPKIDVKIDANVPKSDGGPAACAGATKLTYWTSLGKDALAVCEGYGTNQCNAPSFCAAGWSVCLPSTYALFYPQGKSIPQVMEDGWIGGCVFQGNSQLPPTDGVCGTCFCNSTTTYTVGTQCTSGTPIQVACEDVGLKAASSCWTVGSASRKAMWTPVGATDTSSKRVICCKGK